MDAQGSRSIRIATRASELALHRANMVKRLLEARGHAVELVKVRTAGDRKIDEPLASVGVQGVFTHELQVALRKRKVDCCVHALADLPTATEGLEIGAVLPRDDPRDVLVINRMVGAETLDELPRGSRVGTSSVRRRAQLAARRQDLDIVELRGTVPERLRKLDAGFTHATILAASELQQLGVTQHLTETLEAPEWLPAPGQGATALEIRGDDAPMRDIIGALDDASTRTGVRAERAFIGALEGGAQAPICALAMRDATGGYVLHGLIAMLDGSRVVRGELALDGADPELSGVRLANRLRGEGGSEILEALHRAERLPAPQPE